MITVLTLLLPLFAAVQAEVGISWAMTGGTSTGLTDITFPINMAQAPRVAGYHFGMSFQFLGSPDAAGYIGLQPRPDFYGRDKVYGVFSGSIDGTTSTDHHCGADENPGISCAVEIWSSYDHTYGMEVRSVGPRTWEGTIVDTVTGVRTRIGSWTLPSSLDGIVPSQSVAIDYHPRNDRRQHQCDNLPWARVFFGVPRTTDRSVVLSFSEPQGYHTCATVVRNNLTYEMFSNGILLDIGFRNGTGDFDLSVDVGHNMS